MFGFEFVFFINGSLRGSWMLNGIIFIVNSECIGCGKEFFWCRFFFWILESFVF